MAFENDPEGRRMAEGYAGPGFDKPKTVAYETMDASSGDWGLDEFVTVIREAIDRVPEEYRAEARVELEDDGYHDSYTKLVVRYYGPEHPDVVAARVRRCEEYVAEQRSNDRRTYERLKAKFG